VYRVLPIAGVFVACLGLTGCAGTLDTVTSRRFRSDPFDTTYRMIRPEDPLAILRADPPRSGDERAKAMLRLQEPLAVGLTQQDQDEVIDLLARTATSDPSPVLRLAAVEALGRFQDQRAAGILMLAYQSAHGRTEEVAAVPTVRVPGGRSPLAVPTGFAPEVVSAIRCRVVEGLGHSGRPETIPFLASIAAGPTADGQGPDGANDREVRLAAVRGLGRCRHPDAATALAQVMTAESGKDPAVVGRAHDGLVSLTGQRIPADPARWTEVVQAGVTIAPEPTPIDRAVHWVLGPP
jgi:HEAT repeat protein